MSDAIWFVYDGECPICQMGASLFKLRQSVGQLHTVDARREKDHPVLAEVNRAGLDLDQGMVIKYQDRLYHGREALQLMAQLGADVGWFNRINNRLFKYDRATRIGYPLMKGGRNVAIFLKGVGRIRNLETSRNEQPTFQAIFGEAWNDMPALFHRRYANRPYSHDVVTVEGPMQITASRMMRLLAPLLKLAGALVPHEGSNVPVTVHFRSEPRSRAYCFDRTFHFPGRPPYRFRSRMLPIGGNEVIEYMRFGLGFRGAYTYGNNKVMLEHRGFVWGRIPLPLSLLMGRVHAEEEATGENSFRMYMAIDHPWFGRTYSYGGTFEVKEVRRDG